MTALYATPIRINEIVYEVHNLDSVINEGIEVKGRIRPDLCIIEINRNLPQSVYNQTLMHEIVHAIEIAYCLNLDGKVNAERIVDCFGSGFANLIYDNPNLIKFYLKTTPQNSECENNKDFKITCFTAHGKKE